MKTVVKFRSTKLKYDQESVSYQIAANAPQQAAFPFQRVLIPTTDSLWGNTRYQYADENEARKLFFENPNVWTAVQPGSFNNSNNNDYTAKQETTAAYLQDTMKMGRHSLIAGVRWENTDFERTGKRPRVTLPGPVLTATQVTGK